MDAEDARPDNDLEAIIDSLRMLTTLVTTLQDKVGAHSQGVQRE